jgi:hypothetical protein
VFDVHPGERKSRENDNFRCLTVTLAKPFYYRLKKRHRKKRRINLSQCDFLKLQKAFKVTMLYFFASHSFKLYSVSCTALYTMPPKGERGREKEPEGKH